MQWIKRKDEIEAEILAIVDELQSPGQNGQPAVGLKGNLVDREGFPRNDIDIMRITTMRNRHAILNTDLAELMKDIEKGLHSLHAATPVSSTGSAGEVVVEEEPFLKVNTCHPDSPAFAAGLRAGDFVTRFGAVRFADFQTDDGFSKVSKQVIEDKPIRIAVIRDGNRKTFTLTPKKWSGQGLLGCHLIKFVG